MKKSLIFSFLLLPSSLKKLSESFSVNNPKGIFPILFPNINYKGKVPDIKYFGNKISLDEYKKYKDSFKGKDWNFFFKNESIKYFDCISLYQVITKFNKLIFLKFHMNISKYPTLPSLSFGIYRSHYFPNNKIHSLLGKCYKQISKGYTGGSTDMFIPRNPPGTKVYAYDVNSLYPSVMKDNLYPVGSPTYFEGDIFKKDPNSFGFFYGKVTTPNNLLYPILQIRRNNKTISPLGSWEGIYFSEEIKNAFKFGYKFESKWGYLFPNIFNGYVNDLYTLRLNYPKSDPMNMVAKLLLNSLYGRFGMVDELPNSTVIKDLDYNNFIQKIGGEDKIDNIIDLDSHKLIQYFYQINGENIDKNTPYKGGKFNNVNIAIAAAVTAYARIHMSQFKNKNNIIYYTDTDSLYIGSPLPESYVDTKKLGALKLEGIYDNAIFLAPKVYGLKNKDSIILKVKGVKKEVIDSQITFELLESLLKKSSKK